MAKILIAEDDPNLRKILQSVFTRRGYDVVAVEDGHKAFQEATRGDFNVFITDIAMPDWDGIDAIGSLNIIMPDLKVIVASAYAEEKKYRDELNNLPNVVGIFKKPFSIKELENKVISVLECKDK